MQKLSWPQLGIPCAGTLYRVSVEAHVFLMARRVKLHVNQIVMVVKCESHRTHEVGGNCTECYLISLLVNEMVFENWFTFPKYWHGHFTKFDAK